MTNIKKKNEFVLKMPNEFNQTSYNPNRRIQINSDHVRINNEDRGKSSEKSTKVRGVVKTMEHFINANSSFPNISNLVDVSKQMPIR